MTKEEDECYLFETFFYEDLDSWFSSDIACCDECYDDFLENWPHAYSADDAEFQKQGIPLDCFYSGSRLQDIYSEEQFNKCIQMVGCPRCGAELKHNIWPYDLPFDVIDDFEYEIAELAEIAQKTPFLLLEYPFAKDVYETIKAISKNTISNNISLKLYRARAKDTLQSRDEYEFDFPPQNIVTEGRYNHAGLPVLYLASDPDTCFHEMRRQPSVIAEIELTKKLKILNLANIDESHPEHSDLLSTLIYSSLMSSPQNDSGWYKPKYIFSRFISDCAKFAGFDAIQYPSTRASSGCYNIVLFDEKFSLKQSSTLVRVFDYNEKA
jgi:hypothetical protein